MTSTDWSAMRWWGPLAYLTPPVLLIYMPLSAIVLLVAAYGLRGRYRRRGIPPEQTLTDLLLAGVAAVAIVVVGMCMFPGPVRPFRLSSMGEVAEVDVPSVGDWLVHLVAPLGFTLAAVCLYVV